MMYPRNLEDSKKQLIELKERYGYDNVNEFTVNIPINEVDWIKLHLALPIQNLRNGLEIKLDAEDYETAAIITKIIAWLESDENEIVFDLKNTEGFKQLKVKKK